jgi:uncharacterized protein DUF6915
MAHPYHHALSSVRKWGGEVSDYTPLHSWFDLMWTCKLFHKLSLIEVVVPVVHRRGPAARVARFSAQAERAAGRCLWTHRGEHRAACPISRFRAYWINGRDPRVAPQSGFPLRVGSYP